MNRFYASLIHLLISTCIASLILVLVYFIWYPAPLFRASGGLEIFLLLLGVDVVIGPLLTLVVYKAHKTNLRLDLAIIALIQATALAYGVQTLFAGRPAYVAALGNRFELIQASAVDSEALKKADQFLPLWGPVWVGVKKAENASERERILFSAALGGPDYGHFPQYHAPIETMRDEILKNAEPISILRTLNPDSDAQITKWLTDHGYTDETAKFQVLRTRAEDMAVIVDAETAKVVGIAAFKSW